MRLPGDVISSSSLSNCVLCEICTDYSPSVFKFNSAGCVEVMELEEYPEVEINEVIKNCRGGIVFFGWNNLERV